VVKQVYRNSVFNPLYWLLPSTLSTGKHSCDHRTSLVHRCWHLSHCTCEHACCAAKLEAVTHGAFQPEPVSLPTPVGFSLFGRDFLAPVPLLVERA
jgi:hypothetical protein